MNNSCQKFKFRTKFRRKNHVAELEPKPAIYKGLRVAELSVFKGPLLAQVPQNIFKFRKITLDE
jgi:hypothetical protein